MSYMLGLCSFQTTSSMIANLKTGLTAVNETSGLIIVAYLFLVFAFGYTAVWALCIVVLEAS